MSPSYKVSQRDTLPLTSSLLPLTCEQGEPLLPPSFCLAAKIHLLQRGRLFCRESVWAHIARLQTKHTDRRGRRPLCDCDKFVTIH